MAQGTRVQEGTALGAGLGVTLPPGCLVLPSQSSPGEGLCSCTKDTEGQEEEGQVLSRQLHPAAGCRTDTQAGAGSVRAAKRPQARPRAGSPAPRCPRQTFHTVLCPWAPCYSPRKAGKRGGEGEHAGLAQVPEAGPGRPAHQDHHRHCPRVPPSPRPGPPFSWRWDCSLFPPRCSNCQWHPHSRTKLAIPNSSARRTPEPAARLTHSPDATRSLQAVAALGPHPPRDDRPRFLGCRPSSAQRLCDSGS